MKGLLPLILVVLFAACQGPPVPPNAPPAAPQQPQQPQQPAPPEVEHLNNDAYRQMNVPFSEAVRVGNMLYLSGQVGNLPGQFVLVEGGMEAEARQTLENIKATLERYGSGMDEVVKCTVFLADMAEWGAFNEIYRPYFPENPPARSALGSTGLALEARVEVECMAALR